MIMETHSEDTLFKVLHALMGNEGDGILLERDVAQDLIRRMQNAGILFREFGSDETKEETTIEIEELPLFNKDELMRLECLRFAVDTTPLNRTGNEAQFTTRARYFEQYIRNGEPEGENTNG